jgi:tRNA A58 N-methylase Trm61
MPARHRHRHSSERGKSITITMGSCSRSIGIRVHDVLETVNTMRRNMHPKDMAMIAQNYYVLGG